MIYYSNHYHRHFFECEDCHVQLPYTRKRGATPSYCPECKARRRAAVMQKALHKYYMNNKAGVKIE